MKFSMTVDMDNEAFSDSWSLELSRILAAVQKKVYSMDGASGTIRDANGNTVGSWEVR